MEVEDQLQLLCDGQVTVTPRGAARHRAAARGPRRERRARRGHRHRRDAGRGRPRRARVRRRRQGDPGGRRPRRRQRPGGRRLRAHAAGSSDHGPFLGLLSAGRRARPRCGPAAARCPHPVGQLGSSARSPPGPGGRRTPALVRGRRAAAARRGARPRRGGGGGYGGGRLRTGGGPPLQRLGQALLQVGHAGGQGGVRRRQPANAVGGPVGRAGAGPCAAPPRSVGRRRAGEDLDPADLTARPCPRPGPRTGAGCGRPGMSSTASTSAGRRTAGQPLGPGPHLGHGLDAAAAAGRQHRQVGPAQAPALVGPVAVAGGAGLGARRDEPGQAPGLERQQRVLHRAVVVGDDRVAARWSGCRQGGASLSVSGHASGAAASCSMRHPSTRPSAAVSSMEAMLWPGAVRAVTRTGAGWRPGHGASARH